MANRGFYTSVEGTEDTIRKLGLFEVEKRMKIKGFVKDTSKKVRSTSRKEIQNIDTGDTKRSIRIKYLFEGMGSTVKPRLPKGYKAHWIEYGTEDRTQKKTGKSVGRMKATPFMKPAEEKHRNEFMKNVEKVVRKDITI